MDSNLSSILSQLKSETSFPLELTNGATYNFSLLTAVQLKQLIQTVVDSPITQSAFNVTSSKIMRESLCHAFVNQDPSNFTSVDRLLFVLKTRIESMGPIFSFQAEKKTIKTDLSEKLTLLSDSVCSNSPLLASVQSSINNGVQVDYGVPLISTDDVLHRDLYKDKEFKMESQEDLRIIIGDVFINELARTIRNITVNGQQSGYDLLPFTDRVKVIEQLPASIVKDVIGFIDKYKKVTDGLLVEGKQTIPIDGSLFSLF